MLLGLVSLHVVALTIVITHTRARGAPRIGG